MHAIPTTYSGVNFRSRLEARWAVFFDLLGWSWEYEPLDLAGYIPDFVISGWLLVEVKPLLWQVSREPVAIEVAEKIDASGWQGASLLLGARFVNNQTEYIEEDDCGGPYRSFTVPVGLGLSRGRGQPGDRWDVARIDADSLLVWPEWDRPASQRSLTGSANALAAWRDAGNRVQWRRSA